MDPSHPTDDELIDRLTEALTTEDEAVPEPPANFERAMWARVRPLTTARPSWTWRMLVPAAALAATVLLAIVIGRQPSTSTNAPSTEAQNASAQGLSTGDRVLLTALDDHLEQTEALLVEVRNASNPNDLQWERATADDLVSSGRLYRQSAEFSGRSGVVRMLDDLEPVLLELARSDRTANREREWLKTRIVEDDLLFKVRAMSTDLKELTTR